jgi:hypothetical protein
MTINEAKAQYSLGLISSFQFKEALNVAIANTTDQKEIIEIFWMIIEWEEMLKEMKESKKKPALVYVIHMLDCMYAREAFEANEHAPTYLRKIIYPLAKNRPLPENLSKLYPRIKEES